MTLELFKIEGNIKKSKQAQNFFFNLNVRDTPKCARTNFGESRAKNEEM